jgi:hypothetical protein
VREVAGPTQRVGANLQAALSYRDSLQV